MSTELKFAQVLQEENAELGGNADERSALCISGGGIRSATFNLGIIQGLAKADLLDGFDYLSTVSGGGYIGSWLSAWCHRAGIAKVIDKLKGKGLNSLPEAEEITWLREYSNYLSPRLGVFSADTWTLVATYLRNLLLNWLVFLPTIAAVLIVPRACVWVVRGMAAWNDGDKWLVYVLAILSFLGGAALHVWALAYMDRMRPSGRKKLKTDPGGPTQGQYQKFCLIPLLVSAVLLTVSWIGVQRWSQGLPDSFRSSTAYAIIGWFFFMLGPIGMALTAVAVNRLIYFRPAGGGAGQAGPGTLKMELISVIVGGAVGGSLLWIAASRTGLDPGAVPLAYTCFATPVFLLSFLIGGTLLRALTSGITRDEDREWHARSAGWVLIAAVAWMFVSVIVIYAPSGLLWFGAKWRSILALFGGASGVVSAVLSKSSKTPATTEATRKLGWGGYVRQIGLAAAAPVFLLFLLVMMSLATDWLIGRFKADLRDDVSWHGIVVRQPDSESWLGTLMGFSDYDAKDWHARVVLQANLVAIVVWFCAFALVWKLMGRYVNINRFSLHCVYRDRLIRAYLGASNTQRKPDPFTGFDPEDNVDMYKIKSDVSGRTRLFHIVNVALNYVGGEKLAWQQRKAENFTISPLHCGCRPADRELGYRPTEEYGGGPPGRSAASPGDERRPISIGTAMAISGAAASPNMGQHTSSVIAFLMTLLNVRLGAWLGNPGPKGEKTYREKYPTPAAEPLIAEALGRTDDQHPWVYLSDGGHFENLALYEIVRRRCRYIVICDAGQDETCAFEDLGNAVRKIRADLGIDIEFECMDIYPRNGQIPPGRVGGYIAKGKVHYKKASVDPRPYEGLLLYIKPTFYDRGDEPIDVINYAKQCKQFPHESTADQFFSESQFESYRRLGEHIISEYIKTKPGVSSIKDLTA